MKLNIQQVNVNLNLISTSNSNDSDRKDQYNNRMEIALIQTIKINERFNSIDLDHKDK